MLPPRERFVTERATLPSAQVAGPPAVGGFEGDVGAKSVVHVEVHVGTWKPRIAANTARNTEHATLSSYMVKCLALFVCLQRLDDDARLSGAPCAIRFDSCCRHVDCRVLSHANSHGLLTVTR